MSFTSAYRPYPQGPGAGGQQTASPEVVVVRFRPHAGRLVVPAVLFIVAAWALTFFTGRFSEPWQNILVFAAAAALGLIAGALPFLSWLAHRYTVTTKRVIERRGLFTRIRREIPLRNVREVTLRRGPLQRVAGTGNVALHGTEDGAMWLRGVPSASLVRATLTELIEQVTL